MFVGLGTVINIGTIVLGSSLGILSGARFPEKLRILITDVLGPTHFSLRFQRDGRRLERLLLLSWEE
jgi:uncharacterized membrane protein YqgA involved in biofilm formation